MTPNHWPLQFRLLLVSITLVLTGSAFAQNSQSWSQNTSPLPAPTGFVNDYAGVIDSATKQQLESKLKNLRDTTNPSVEIAVAVVRTTGDREIFDYSLAVARGWKIGSKEQDNPSALLFVAIDDRKYFTQVSKDLEDELPDGVVGNLQRQYLVPEFKKGNYGKGISDTIDAYITTIRNKGNAPVAPSTPTSGGTDSGSGILGICCCLGIIGLVVLVIIASTHKSGPTKGDRNRWGGGGFGSGGGGGRIAGNILSGVIGGLIGSAISSGSSSSDSGSSFDWGSSSSGGGGDWGGFGGGGDFGGGGAGGSW